MIKKNKKKVLYIIRKSEGGMLLHIKTILSMLDREHFVPVVLGDFDKVTADYFTRIHVKYYNVTMDNNLINSLKHILKVRDVIKKENPDLIHMHGYIAALIGRISCIGIHKKQIIITVHNLMPSNKSLKFLLKCFEKLFSTSTSAYITVSDDLKNHIINELKVPENKVIRIYNGIQNDLAFKSTAITSSDDCINFKKVITVARLIPSKGIEYFILAAGKILHKRKDVIFFIAGDGPLRHQLEELVAHKNLSKQIIFLGFRDDVNSLISSSDLFVLPSFFEGLPISCLEAMRSRKPIVSTWVGGIPEEVKDGINGILVKPGNVTELATAIERYLDNPRYGEKCGENGYKIYEQLFTAKRMIEQTLNIYDSIGGQNAG